MKFLMFFKGGYGSLDPQKAKERMEKMAKLSKKVQAEGHVPAKALTPSYVYADGSKGFRIFETDDLENLAGIVAFYEFEHAEIIPIIETLRAIEIVEELKQYM
ncbi:MAG: DUF3303 domain-containing protein [Candidatus Thorarchaeota archaeon]